VFRFQFYLIGDLCKTSNFVEIAEGEKLMRSAKGRSFAEVSIGEGKRRHINLTFKPDAPYFSLMKSLAKKLTLAPLGAVKHALDNAAV